MAGLAAAPAAAAPHDHGDDIAPPRYLDEQGRLLTGAAKQLTAAHVGDGFTTFAAIANYPNLRMRARYTLRLVSNGNGDVETMRSAAQLAAANVGAAGGASITVAPGTIADASGLEPADGEILMSIDDNGPCESGYGGCGEAWPRARGADRATVFTRGRIWLETGAPGYTPRAKNHLVAHELGHALGLDHHDSYYLGEVQVMHRREHPHDAETYRAGDRNGLAYLGTRRAPGVAFNSAVTEELWTYESDTGSTDDTELDVASGTSPSIATTTNGDNVVAYQGTDGFLHVKTDTALDLNTRLAMGWASSPSVTALPHGGWIAAFQNHRNELWTVDQAGTFRGWGLSVLAGTSPSVTAFPGGGWIAAFQNHANELWTVDNANFFRGWGLGVASGTSPSIAALPAGGWVTAFQANDNQLWTVDQSNWFRGWGLGMAAGTSPSITAFPGGGWITAFQSHANGFWTVDNGNFFRDWRLSMNAGTSPAIAARPGGGWTAAFQDHTGELWTVDQSNWFRATGLGLDAGTSPAIARGG